MADRTDPGSHCLFICAFLMLVLSATRSLVNLCAGGRTSLTGPWSVIVCSQSIQYPVSSVQSPHFRTLKPLNSFGCHTPIAALANGPEVSIAQENHYESTLVGNHSNPRCICCSRTDIQHAGL